MATNYGNTFNDIFSGVESLPLSQALTGTFSVPAGQTAVTGTGSLLLTEVGYTGVTSLSTPSANASLGYLWDTTNGEWRQVTDVLSDTLCFIEKGFTNAQVGATLKYIPQTRLKSITYTDDSGAGGGKVNGKTLTANESGGWSAEDWRNTHVTPTLFDGTGGSISVEWSYV